MKSSRQRFAEFRDKIRKGLLDPTRFADPARKDAPEGGAAGAAGGHHTKYTGPIGKYEFKHNKKRLFGEYRVMLAGYYRPVLSLLLLAVITSLLSFVMPVSLKILLDDIAPVNAKGLRGSGILSPLGKFRDLLTADRYHSLLVIVAVLTAAAIIAIALDWLRLLAVQRVNYRLAGSLRIRLHKHLSKLSLAQIADYKTGGVVSRIMGDTDQVVGGVQNAIINPVNAAFRILLTIAVIVFTAPQLSIAAAILIPPIIIIHFLIFRQLRPMWRNIQDDRSILSGKLTDMYGGIRVVRSFRRERSEWKEFNAGQDTMIRKQQYTAVLGRLLNTGWNTFGPAIGIVIHSRVGPTMSVNASR